MHPTYHQNGDRAVTTTDGRTQQAVGELLRLWRARRRLSQLDLAIQADISARHLSFVETGRSAPSRDMVLRLAENLEVPLRERNGLLLAAGYAPLYSRQPLDSPGMSAVRSAIRQVLTGHEPYPAIVVDREWNLADANASAGLFTRSAAPELLTPPVNALRIALHPGGMAPYIVNLGEWRAHLLGRLHRQVALTAEPALSTLYDELRSYPCDQPEPDVAGQGDLVVPLRIRHDGAELAFMSIVATFGTPLDVTVAELAIESFFPADPATADALHGMQRGA
jgi:transcriptional regulator with XRE-family HTH domain